MAKIKGEKVYKEGVKLLILGLKVSKPDLTDKEAENVIINTGNYLQLRRLSKGVKE